MKPELTIIIPCYNCQKTLRETVDSCYIQGIPEQSFEIILVDDGSKDGTRTLIESLSKEHSNIRFAFHEQNRGGGAARNTAVSYAQAEIIFCLDSDDLLPQHTLPKMIALLKNKKCDGVVFEGCYSFSTDKNKYRQVTFGIEPNRPITFEDIFSGKPWNVGGNFLYTKQAFATAGGYPTNHSFDTQGYGLRFLAAGLKACVCPGAYMYQRQFAEHESYFERAYTSGEFSVGHYVMLREQITKFSPSIREYILNFDIFKRNTLEDNILTALQQKYKADKDHFFASPTDNKNLPTEYANKNFDETGDRSAIVAHKSNLLRPNIFARLIRKIKHIYARLRH